MLFEMCWAIFDCEARNRTSHKRLRFPLELEFDSQALMEGHDMYDDYRPVSCQCLLGCILDDVPLILSSPPARFHQPTSAAQKECFPTYFRVNHLVEIREEANFETVTKLMAHVFHQVCRSECLSSEEPLTF